MFHSASNFHIFLCLAAVAGVSAAGIAYLVLRLRARENTIAALREAIVRLRVAYTEIEAAKPMAELGRSIASVNHEIKNHLMVMSGYTSLLIASKDLNERERGMADSVAQATAKLQELSAGISDMSRSALTHDNKEIDLAQGLKSCIDSGFRDQSHVFSLTAAESHDSVVVNGNSEKLETAAACVLRNAIEAGARNVNLRLYVCNYMALTVVDDDGAGCDAERLSKLSETFFTTKENHEISGLGLPLTRSIIEAHNGSVSIYSKNLLGGENRGLSAQIVIPASKKTKYKATASEIMIVKEGMDDTILGVMKVLGNLKVIPHVVENATKVNFTSRSTSLALTVFAAAATAGKLREQAAGNAAIMIVAVEAGAYGTLFADGEGKRDLFTEEYIVRRMCDCCRA
jgi:signal transduction histidine kinase